MKDIFVLPYCLVALHLDVGSLWVGFGREYQPAIQPDYVKLGFGKFTTCAYWNDWVKLTAIGEHLRIWIDPMTKCSPSFLVLFLIGLRLGDSYLVILFLYSLVLFSFVLSVFLPLCLFFSFFSCTLCSASASLHLAVFLNIHISYLSKKKKNWTLFSVWLLHLISFVSLVSWQWPQRRLLRERIGIKRGREGGWWKKQQWGCWSFRCNRQPKEAWTWLLAQTHYTTAWCHGVSWLLLLLLFYFQNFAHS